MYWTIGGASTQNFPTFSCEYLYVQACPVVVDWNLRFNRAGSKQDSQMQPRDQLRGKLTHQGDSYWSFRCNLKCPSLPSPPHSFPSLAQPTHFPLLLTWNCVRPSQVIPCPVPQRLICRLLTPAITLHGAVFPHRWVPVLCRLGRWSWLSFCAHTRIPTVLFLSTIV